MTQRDGELSESGTSDFQLSEQNQKFGFAVARVPPETWDFWQPVRDTAMAFPLLLLQT